MTTVTTATAVETIKGIQPLIEKIAAVFEAVNGAVDPDESVPAFMALYASFKPLVKWLDRDLSLLPGGFTQKGVKVAEWRQGDSDYCVIFTRTEVVMYTNFWTKPCTGNTAARHYLEFQKCDFTLIINSISDLLGVARTKLTERSEKLESRRQRLVKVLQLLSEATTEAERLVKPEVPLPPKIAAA